MNGSSEIIELLTEGENYYIICHNCGIKLYGECSKVDLAAKWNLRVGGHTKDFAACIDEAISDVQRVKANLDCIDLYWDNCDKEAVEAADNDIVNAIDDLRDIMDTLRAVRDNKLG
jgi:hypothetical protein